MLKSQQYLFDHNPTKANNIYIFTLIKLHTLNYYVYLLIKHEYMFVGFFL